MNTLEIMRLAVQSKTAKVLTTDIAESLKGKKIRTIYFGHKGQDGVDEFVVGDVISELDYYRNLKEDCYVNHPKGFTNRAEEWESWMTVDQLSRYNNTMLLMTADGRNTFIRAHEMNDGAFTCSDVDRFVYFVDVEDDIHVVFTDCGINNDEFQVVSESAFLNRFKFNPGTQVLFQGSKSDVDAWVVDYCKANNIERR